MTTTSLSPKKHLVDRPRHQPLPPPFRPCCPDNRLARRKTARAPHQLCRLAQIPKPRRRKSDDRIPPQAPRRIRATSQSPHPKQSINFAQPPRQPFHRPNAASGRCGDQNTSASCGVRSWDAVDEALNKRRCLRFYNDPYPLQDLLVVGNRLSSKLFKVSPPES